jgi:UDP-N-acetylglucosamine pyrophosphorylase
MVSDKIQVLKEGDVISWELEKNHGWIKKGIYSAKIAIVDLNGKQYGVWASYGQDFIPFEDVIIG